MDNIRITIATFSAIGLYSVGCLIWKQLKKFKRLSLSRPDTFGTAELPRELWLDIVEKYLSTDPHTKDLLNISLVDKTTCQLVEQYYASKIKSVQPNTSTKQLITPKICYFMKLNSQEAQRWLSLDEPMPIYGPWMENNPLKAPQTVFKFISLLIRAPKWFKYYLTNSTALKRVTWNFKNRQRMSPLLAIIRVVSLTPFLDYLLNKFTSGEFVWSNLLRCNINEWKTDPLALLVPSLMLMSTHPLDINFYDIRSVVFRIVLFAVLAGFHYGALATILPIIVTTLMFADPLRDIDARDKATAFAAGTAIVSAIFFPATAYCLACLMYTLYDVIMYNRRLPKISYRRNFLIAAGITFGGILWLIK